MSGGVTITESQECILRWAITETFESMHSGATLSRDECQRIAGLVIEQLAQIVATAPIPLIGVPSKDSRLSPRQPPTHRLALISACSSDSEGQR